MRTFKILCLNLTVLDASLINSILVRQLRNKQLLILVFSKSDSTLYWDMTENVIYFKRLTCPIHIIMLSANIFHFVNIFVKSCIWLVRYKSRITIWRVNCVNGCQVEYMSSLLDAYLPNELLRVTTWQYGYWSWRRFQRSKYICYICLR